tara:strand:+ start:214 stop:825 length:612 start_codon:yes stop_codon:yes gene_type:complete
MSLRPLIPDEMFSARQRLCLFHGSTCSAEEALALEENQITADFFVSKGVKASNMIAAGIGPSKLKKLGVHDCLTLRKIGFDSLHLADTTFAAEANAAYGSKSMISAFLSGACDAVAIAGTDAVDIFGIHAQDLLVLCAGAPTEALAVLKQLPAGMSLEGVDVTVILDTGVRKAGLADAGYSLSSIASQTKASAWQLNKLGFVI